MPKCKCCGQDLPADDSMRVLLAGIRMSRTARTVIDVISAGRGQHVHAELIVNALWGNDINGGPEDPRKVIGVYICRLRKLLKPIGLTIVVQYYSGWAIRPIDSGVQVDCGRGTRAGIGSGSVPKQARLIPQAEQNA